MDIVISIIIKIIDVLVAIASFFERETSKLLTKLLKRDRKHKAD